MTHAILRKATSGYLIQLTDEGQALPDGIHHLAAARHLTDDEIHDACGTRGWDTAMKAMALNIARTAIKAATGETK